MKDHQPIINWAQDVLVSQGYRLEHAPEIVLETPWSNVIRFVTSKDAVYLKQTPPALFLEPKITKLLAEQFHASVPTVIASNDNLHCFLMQSAGQALRKCLKTDFQPQLLGQAVNQYTKMQRSTENHLDLFLALGVPDWRLDRIPELYNQLINQTALLKADGMTDKELQSLQSLSPKLAEQCKLLSQYQIPETIVQYDFHSNNILFDAGLQKITVIDLGEIVITHPFFSLYNFLGQIVKHDGIKKSDQNYHDLENAYIENWLELASKQQLLEGMKLIKVLWPIYSALAANYLMQAVGVQSFKSHYGNKLASFFREYISSMSLV